MNLSCRLKRKGNRLPLKGAEALLACRVPPALLRGARSLGSQAHANDEPSRAGSSLKPLSCSSLVNTMKSMREAALSYSHGKCSLRDSPTPDMLNGVVP